MLHRALIIFSLLIIKKFTMKKHVLIFMTSFVLSLTMVSCGNNATDDKSAQAVSGNGMYACPMDAEVTSDKPGTCSKCGMELEKVNATDSTKTNK